MSEAIDSGQISSRFGQWLDRRIPPGKRITLSQHNVFIFPTRMGFVFGGLIVVLILGAINYQSSLVYGVAFLLGTMLLIGILYTFRNLSGVSLELVGTRAGFVGEDIGFDVRLVRPQGRGREGIQIGWPDGIKQWAELCDQEADTVRMYVKGTRRGWLRPGRLLVETYYPLGLLRAWTWVDLNAAGLVYPKPIFTDIPAGTYGRRDEGELIDPLGSDDFTDLKTYLPGDSVKHIIWRSYARSDELMVKRYASFVEPRLWFDLDQIPGGVEERLGRLTGLALRATRLEREFGLRLDGMEIAPGVGDAHLEQVLRELALYGMA
ncbi:MAG: DUF58 domain-containing protein [Pseudomonadales bacterium]|jgi:uncharacterized protein (DUF58 family)|nr:DUF58 domain-containing protein [Pseudomonadales bacterium]MDP6473138.1 DUF58 domain-containing protein [Pseudomonadales bacterium]MDP6826105.1 DUF58 domain-containing protein [Pseudomonadales bacterium]MDP6971519.1 DUF58 domain-containing protein [Pseudomonadales bacterium]|tara:strand:- start:260 stop:1222 length:963 start_codon:yes stop_codon:yes gene_type:complete